MKTNMKDSETESQENLSSVAGPLFCKPCQSQDVRHCPLRLPRFYTHHNSPVGATSKTYTKSHHFSLGISTGSHASTSEPPGPLPWTTRAPSCPPLSALPALSSILHLAARVRLNQASSHPCLKLSKGHEWLLKTFRAPGPQPLRPHRMPRQALLALPSIPSTPPPPPRLSGHPVSFPRSLALVQCPAPLAEGKTPEDDLSCSLQHPADSPGHTVGAQ